MKTDSDVPLRTMGSLSLARQLTGAGLVDRLRLMTFPPIVGDTGREPVFANTASAASSWSITERWMAECSSWSIARPEATSHGPEPGRWHSAAPRHRGMSERFEVRSTAATAASAT